MFWEAKTHCISKMYSRIVKSVSSLDWQWPRLITCVEYKSDSQPHCRYLIHTLPTASTILRIVNMEAKHFLQFPNMTSLHAIPTQVVKPWFGSRGSHCDYYRHIQLLIVTVRLWCDCIRTSSCPWPGSRSLEQHDTSNHTDVSANHCCTPAPVQTASPFSLAPPLQPPHSFLLQIYPGLFFNQTVHASVCRYRLFYFVLLMKFKKRHMTKTDNTYRIA